MRAAYVHETARLRPVALDHGHPKGHVRQRAPSMCALSEHEHDGPKMSSLTLKQDLLLVSIAHVHFYCQQMKMGGLGAGGWRNPQSTDR